MMTIPPKLFFIYLRRQLLENPELNIKSEAKIRKRLNKKNESLPLGKTVEVERVHIKDFVLDDWITAKKFRKPFVVEGIYDGNNVLNWEDLKTKYSDCIVPVHEEAEISKKWQYVIPKKQSIGEAVSKIEKGQMANVVSSSQIFVDYPEVLERLNVKKLNALFDMKVLRNEIFIGGKGSGSAFHCAGGSNFFLMANGKKRWVFVDPKDTLAMYPTVGRKKSSAFFGSPISTTSKNEDYPLFDKVTKYHTVLNQGDLLFNPPWWWHEVYNVEDSIGIPMRSAGIPFFNHIGGRSVFFSTLYILSNNHIKNFWELRRKTIQTDDIPNDSFGGRDTNE
ncbi:cupin-like domain-containing protein [Flavivirga algicola]|uniref:JmjC domain-containing protein n=1 Tax=Flavivirga algicola TaxID=2729136 RepID=A0ABX1S119_9FLAO|nr:cupin-like domain-containing protein [Flavivirga algicola]NMH89581.1 hypothetical protein [Flavivirga algicola]